MYIAVGPSKRSTNIIRKMPGLLSAVDHKTLARFSFMASELFPYGVFMEVGTFCAKSACILGLYGKCPVFTIDPHDGIRDGKKEPLNTERIALHFVNLLNLQDKVTLIKGRSTDLRWQDRDIGLLFIDGNHEYEDVIADYKHFKPFLLPGAFVLFHDYGLGAHPDVKKAVDELNIEKVDIIETMYIGKANGADV